MHVGLCVYLLQISVLEVLIYEMLVGMLSLGQQKRDGWGGDKLVNSQTEIRSLATKYKTVALWPSGLYQTSLTLQSFV